MRRRVHASMSLYSWPVNSLKNRILFAAMLCYIAMREVARAPVLTRISIRGMLASGFLSFHASQKRVLRSELPRSRTLAHDNEVAIPFSPCSVRRR